jgi:N-acetyl-gamma-glutamyl-phosphate reductase
MISVGIIGGSGYTGKNLVKYCSQHPFIKEFQVYGLNSANKSILELFPEFKGIIQNRIIRDINLISEYHDVYFLALPHGEALKYVPHLYNIDKKIIDLGGDYRLDSASDYENWYGKKHTSSDLLSEKLYGLADLSSLDYSNIKLIANPGCYPTAALLSLTPLVKYFSKNIFSISTSAYSGTSGAGKTAREDLLMSEMDGNAAAYNLNTHRHQPEIEQMLNKNGFNGNYSFAAHLLPIAVGIYSTSFIYLADKLKADDIADAFQAEYKNSVFLRMREKPPQLKWVVNSNFCDIHFSVKDNNIIVTSAIDNLIKGASGQAVQNLNRLFGWEDYLGILNDGAKDVSIY